MFCIPVGDCKSSLARDSPHDTLTPLYVMKIPNDVRPKCCLGSQNGVRTTPCCRQQWPLFVRFGKSRLRLQTKSHITNFWCDGRRKITLMSDSVQETPDSRRFDPPRNSHPEVDSFPDSTLHTFMFGMLRTKTLDGTEKQSGTIFIVTTTNVNKKNPI